MTWRHCGGGCALYMDNPYPCDDEYEHEGTGERFRVFTTVERHASMPQRVQRPEQVFSLTGTAAARIARVRGQ
jgi:hypothetical protein